MNGKSQGVRVKDPSRLYRRYRLIWDDVPYETGQIKIIAYDDNGNPAMERVIHTAGKPHQLQLDADKEMIRADSRDMVFITISVADNHGCFCPKASNKVGIRVKGAAKLLTIAVFLTVNVWLISSQAGSREPSQ